MSGNNRSISVVNLKYLYIESTFSGFWPLDAQPQYAALNRASRTIVGYSIGRSEINIFSILNYFTNGERPQIAQVELQQQENWVGLELSDSGQYLIVASVANLLTSSGSMTKLFRMKVLSFNNSKIQIVKEKVLPIGPAGGVGGHSPGKITLSKASTGTDMYVLTDRHQVHLLRFISTIQDFELLSKQEPLQVYFPQTDITGVATNEGYAVLLASNPPKESIKLLNLS